MTQRKDAGQVAELVRLGELGLEIGAWEQAERYFEQALRLEPGDPAALLGKARAMRDPVRALAFLREALTLRPTWPEGWALEALLVERVRGAVQGEGVPWGEGAASQAPASDGAPSVADSSSDPGATPRDDRPALSTDDVSSIPGKAAPPGAGRTSRRGPTVGQVALGVLMLTVALGVGVPSIRHAARRDAPEAQAMGEAPAMQSLLATPYDALGAYARAGLATVRIATPNDDGEVVGWGSGSLVGAQGLVLTNLHVVAQGAGEGPQDEGPPANRLGIVFVGLTTDVRTAPDAWFIAVTAASDRVRDLAVLRIVATGDGRNVSSRQFPTMPPGQPDRLTLGQDLVGLGYPPLGGDTLTLTRGTMAGFAQRDGVQLGKTDSELLPGSSGGAVLDDDGRLVGVVVGVSSDTQTQGRLSYFVLLSEAQSLMRQAHNAPPLRPPLPEATGLFRRTLASP